MQKYGLVIAIGRELTGVLDAFGNVREKYDDVFPVYKVQRANAEIYVVASGVGEIYAAAATQYLISTFHVDALLNFGFVGALKGDLKCQQVVLVKDVVHYELDTSAIDGVPVGQYFGYEGVEIPLSKKFLEKAKEEFPQLAEVRLASGDKFIASAEKKNRLIDTFGAEICDMEGAGIALTADKNNVPLLSVKVVSDNADESSPVSFTEIANKGTADCASILTRLIDVLSARQ